MPAGSAPLTIQAQATPNPNAVKFTLNRVVSEQGKTYRDAAAAEAGWAGELLGIPGVVQVFTVNNFVSISKSSEADWGQLIPQAEQVLKRVFG